MSDSLYVSCLFCVWSRKLLASSQMFSVHFLKAGWLLAAPTSQVRIKLLFIAVFFYFCLSSFNYNTPLKQMPVNNLKTNRQISRMGNLCVHAFFPLCFPFKWLLENEAKLLTSCWRILSIIAVGQEFSIPTAKVKIWTWENLFPEPAVRS